jgi:hypothetical protein
MERIRTAIGEGTFHELHRAERARWKDFSDLVESTP